MEDLCADCVGKTINRRLCFRFILVPVLTAPPTRSSYESCSSSYEECLTTAAPAAPPTAPTCFCSLLRIWIRGNSIRRRILSSTRIELREAKSRDCV